MSEPQQKKRKTSGNLSATNAPKITDSRFESLQSDPRYRLPGRRNKVKIDKRFFRALQDDDFSRKAKVDRYGRLLDNDAEKRRLKTKYELEEESDEPDEDGEVQKELQRISKDYDPLREGRQTDSSSEDSSGDEESEIDDEPDIETRQEPEVPVGDISSRLAVVNLDWDNIRAEDLMAVFSSSSLLPPTGKLLKVSIYPSEFGKERMEREEMEGPPKEIFANQKTLELSESDESENEDGIKDSIIKPDDGSEFDSKILRQYQLDRLRYFYAVLTFSSPSAAKNIYDAIDGTEYLSSANFFDLRFVPDDIDFSSDKPREECESISSGYKPTTFVTDALQHSKVKLTWDAEDGGRKEAVARAFKKGRKEIDEDDLRAYLDSENSDEEEEEPLLNPEDTAAELVPSHSGPISKKEEERKKMRALLGLAAEPQRKRKKERGPTGDIQITFSAGLSGANQESNKQSVFENSPEPEETTMEKYIRKEKERKQKRREKMKVAREGGIPEDTDPQQKPTESAAKDLGFDDPFFVEPSLDKDSVNKTRKEEKKRKRAEREADEEAERKQRAELELLMADDNAADGTADQLRHFDMREIEKQEKQDRKKKSKKKQKYSKDAATSQKVDGDTFKVDTSDPRFSRLFESHEYAIDPTNPRYKGTKGMNALLEEGRRRRGTQHVQD